MPRINRSLARRTQLEPAPDPDALGAIEGRAQVALGGAVRGVGETVRFIGDTLKRVKDGHDRQETAFLAQDGDRRLSELGDRASLEKFDGREAFFQKESENIFTDLSEGLNPNQKTELRFKLNQSRNRTGDQVRGTVYRDASNGAKLNLADTLSMAAEDAAESVSDIDVADFMQRGDEAIDFYADDFGISDAERADIKDRFRANIVELREPAMRERQASIIATDILTDTDAAGDPLSREARLEIVGQIPDDELRADVKRRVEVTTNREEFERAEILSDQREAAWTAVLDGGGYDVIPKDLPGKDRKALMAHVSKRSSDQAKGKSLVIITDVDEWNKQITMIAEAPDKFAEQNIWALRKFFAKTEWTEIKGAWDALHAGDDSFEPAIDGADRQFLNDTMRAAGIKDTPTQARMRLSFKRGAEVQRKQNGGKDLTIDQREQIAGQVMSEIDVPGFAGLRLPIFGPIFGETKRIGDLTEDDAKAILDNPSHELKDLAIKSWKRRGVTEPDEEQVTAAIAGILKALGVAGVE